MFFNDKQIKLKNGKDAVLRSPRVDDAAEMISYLNDVCSETDFLARYPEEKVYTVEKEEKFLTAIVESPSDLMIVCTVDGKVAGNCHIVFMTTIKTRHRATVMIALRREFWGLGIGQAMFREMIAAAKAHGTEQLELEMIEGNERAMGLYRKMGFEVVAKLPDAYRFKDGSLHSAIFMQKRIDGGAK